MLSKTDAGKKEQIETAQQRKEIERMEATEATDGGQPGERKEGGQLICVSVSVTDEFGSFPARFRSSTV